MPIGIISKLLSFADTLLIGIPFNVPTNFEFTSATVSAWFISIPYSILICFGIGTFALLCICSSMYCDGVLPNISSSSNTSPPFLKSNI